VKTVIVKFFENKKYIQNLNKKNEIVKKRKWGEDGQQQPAADNIQPNNSSKKSSSQWKQTLSAAGFSQKMAFSSDAVADNRNNYYSNMGMCASSLQNKAITTPSFPESYNRLNTASSTGSLSEMQRYCWYLGGF
jgi:hypothetical protein